jgi:D-arabinose 1-dehydrogenase-like Zn-dependent alcohol dehydrogenase
VKGIGGYSKAMLVQGVDLTEKHNLHPVIKVFARLDAVKAFEVLRNQDFVGKVVIKVD